MFCLGPYHLSAAILIREASSGAKFPLAPKKPHILRRKITSDFILHFNKAGQKHLGQPPRPAFHYHPWLVVLLKLFAGGYRNPVMSDGWWYGYVWRPSANVAVIQILWRNNYLKITLLCWATVKYPVSV